MKVLKMTFIPKEQKKLIHKKTDVHHNDDIWSLDILDIKYYGPENSKKL